MPWRFFLGLVFLWPSSCCDWHVAWILHLYFYHWGIPEASIASMKSQMEKKYPVIAGREKGTFIYRKLAIHKVLCRAINIIIYVQLVTLVWKGEHWREQSGGLLSMPTCQDLLLSVKNAPTCSTERSYADAMLCPGLCLDVSLWVSIHDCQTIWAFS